MRASYKDVAIYLDGYTYHASEKHMRFYEDLVIRDAINDSPNIASWSLSWSDLILFEKESADERMDNLYLSPARYRNTLQKLNQIPISSQLNKGLVHAKNSMERLLWYLANSANPNLNKELGYFIAAYQPVFGEYSYLEEEANRLLDQNVDSTDIERTNPSGDTYMLSGLTTANELFKSRVLVRLKDLNILSSIKESELNEIDRSVWEDFLRIYSLLRIK